MNEIISIETNTVDGQLIQTVNARALHQYLCVGRGFSDWIKDRIDKYDFIDGVDYVLTEHKTGVRQNVLQKDYHISLDMAKELSMTENNAQGKIARTYFISCEKKLNSVQVIDFNNPKTLLPLLENYARKTLVLEATIEAQKPAVAFVERYVEHEGAICLREGFKSIGKKPTIFTNELVAEGILYRTSTGNVSAKQAHIAAGHFVHRVTEFQTQVLVTHKGLEYLANKFN